ncbi:MAG: hypothetical protein ABIJ34_00685 [archaeon]
MVYEVINTIYDISPGYWIEFLLEFIFAAVTFLVGLFSWKVYILTQKQQIKHFSFSFFFISLGYLVQSVFNFLILFELKESLTDAFELFRLVIFDRLGLSIHIFMMITGLTLLLWMTLRTSAKSLWLLFAVSMVSLYFSTNKLYMFFILSSLYLAFITIYYVVNYFRKKQKNTFVIALAFIFLLIGRAHFIFIQNSALFFHIGHAFELIAYALILLNFSIIQHEQKKRPA